MYSRINQNEARSARGAPGQSSTSRRLRLENLEPRLLLDSSGFINGTDVHLTLSFAPENTPIAGQPNQLAGTFDSLPGVSTSADWQDAILRAFQTWVVETNADVGLVSDDGDPFGTPGSSQRDERFGDVRIGAIAMSPEVGAVSVPVNGVASGTWFADVVFNTDYAYQSLDDLFAIALHEAGNVLGLEDSSDPESPLFTGSMPTGLTPTATDLADLHQLHGERIADLNEQTEEVGSVVDNDSFGHATRVHLVEFQHNGEGSAPSIVYGDLTTATDRDFFRIQTSDDYDGTMTLEIRTEGISLLMPQVTLYDQNQQQLDQQVSTITRGDVLIFQVAVSGDDLYVEISAAQPGLYSIGGYSLVAKFDGINQVEQATIDMLASGEFHFLAQEEFASFFDSEEESFFAPDASTNETLLTALELKTTPGYFEGVRYETIGSIETAGDVDSYQIKSPAFDMAVMNVMTVHIETLDKGKLIPQVKVFDKNDNLVQSTILANGGGEYLIQIAGTGEEDDYTLQVEAADSAGPFNLGNYELTVTFGTAPATLDSLAAGVVGGAATQNTHTLYVSQAQLFHLLLSVDAQATSSPTAILLTITNEAEQQVYQIAARPGESRSREAVLLQPGTYSIEVVPWTIDGSVSPELGYELRGASISDPFVGDPEDPTTNPFACTEPGLEGHFCYPGDIVSPDPFLWDNFIASQNDPPPPMDLNTLVTNLLGDWWRWVWISFGVNGPPLALGDTTHVQQTSSLVAAAFVGPTGSVLQNDVDPESDPVVAIKKSDPAHGSLTLDPSGTFAYLPDPGFAGRDEFTYSAFDFMQESSAATVSIIVGVSGDFDASGSVDGHDFLAWQRGVGNQAGAVLTDGDSNFDGVVDAADLAVWSDQYPPGPITSQLPGDATGDGSVDGSDFLAWQRGYGIAVEAGTADGDLDRDGDVDAPDLTVWKNNYGTTSEGTELLSAAPLLASADPVSNTAPPVAVVAAETSTPTGPVAKFPANVILELPAVGLRGGQNRRAALRAAALQDGSTVALQPANASTPLSESALQTGGGISRQTRTASLLERDAWFASFAKDSDHSLADAIVDALSAGNRL